MHIFVAVFEETTGAKGADALELFSDVGRRIRAVTHEEQSHAFVVQQVLVVLQLLRFWGSWIESLSLPLSSKGT